MYVDDKNEVRGVGKVSSSDWPSFCGGWVIDVRPKFVSEDAKERIRRTPLRAYGNGSPWCPVNTLAFHLYTGRFLEAVPYSKEDHGGSYMQVTSGDKTWGIWSPDDHVKDIGLSNMLLEYPEITDTHVQKAYDYIVERPVQSSVVSWKRNPSNTPARIREGEKFVRTLMASLSTDSTGVSYEIPRQVGSNSTGNVTTLTGPMWSSRCVNLTKAGTMFITYLYPQAVRLTLHNIQAPWAGMSNCPMVMSVMPALLLNLDEKSLFTSAADHMGDMLEHNNQRTAWLVDVASNILLRQGAYDTCSFIEGMMHRVGRDTGSIQLSSGKTLYFAVIPWTASNPNSDNTCMAGVVSFDPITLAEDV